MRDLTTGSIRRHILVMAAPISAGMMFQVLYILVDLYFVARLGPAAVAGVGAAANANFMIMALAQMIGVGTVALISHAAGRKDAAAATAIFNEAMALSLLFSAGTLILGLSLSGLYMRAVSADANTVAAGTAYLRCFTPGLALQFTVTAIGSALRATGIVQGPILVQIGTVVLNIILAPILIAGWGTGQPLGTAGAGLATSLAIAIGVAVLIFYFLRLEKFVAVHPAQWLQAHLKSWGKLLWIGIPAGGEMALLFFYSGIIYVLIARFGPSAQAGFTVGMRIMQAFFLPVMAVAFSASPIAGQNFGAGNHARVRETLLSAVLISSVLMLLVTLLCQWRPEPMIRFFTHDAEAISIGATYLRIISWNFVAVGIVFSCSGIFQALGNTWPSLISSASRLITFAIPVLWLSSRPDFTLLHVWYVSVATMALQAVTSLVLVFREMARKRAAAPSTPSETVVAAA